MTKQSKALLEQALQLNSLEKAQLVEGLLVSLDTPDASLDMVWAKEANARVEAFNAGEVAAKDVADVLVKYSRP